MEENICGPELYTTCQPALEELKVAFLALEKLRTCEGPKETLHFFDSIWKTINLVKERACCCRTNDCVLLLLTVISKCFIKLGTGAKQGIICKSYCGEDTSNDAEESTLNGLRCTLHRDSTVLVATRSLLHTNNFVSYKASKVFLHYFEQLPCVIADCRESIQPILFECAKSNSAVFMTLLHDVIKLVRRNLQGIGSEFGLKLDNGMCAQVKLLVAFLRCCNETFDGDSFETSNHVACNIPLCIARVEAVYQAEKLNRYVLHTSKKNETFETPPSFFQPEQLKSLTECLNVFLSSFLFKWKSIFAEGEFENSYITLYKLKILLLKTKDYASASNEIIQLAREILNHFVQDANVIDHFGNIKFHGFGGKLMAIVSDSELASSKEYNQFTQNLQLFILVILNSCACVLHGDYSSSFCVSLELGERALTHLSVMLDCACKNYYGHSNTAHYEQLTDNFCAVLVRVMMDDDDQLCRAVETLLCLYTKMAERCSILGIRRPNQEVLNERFPHMLFCNLLQEISFDHLVCIDWLISDETCFGSSLRCYLDIVIADFSSFVRSLDQTGRSHDSNRGRTNDIAREHTNWNSSSDEVAPPHSACNRISEVRSDDFCATSCFDILDQNSSKKGVKFGNCFQGVKRDESIDFCRSGGNMHLGCDKWLLNSAEDHPRDDPVRICESSDNVGTDVTTFVIKEASKAFISLVDYSSSDSDDYPDNDANATESCFVSNAEDEAREEHGNFAKVSAVDCEVEPCTSEGSVGWLSRSDTTSDESSCKDDATRQETLMNRAGSEKWNVHHWNLDENFGDDIADNTTEIFMDFLIRLRLKLERIEGNSLSTKDFKGLISQLNIIENSYDSLAHEVTNQVSV